MSYLEVNWVHPDGHVGGRDGKNTFRVRGAVPGDRIRPLSTTKKGRTTTIDTWELHTPSPDRRSHPCPIQRDCGGCDLGELGSERRALALRTMVARAVRQRALPAFVPSPRARGHRARVKLAVDGSTVGYRALRSHDIVDVVRCDAARPELQPVLDTLRAAGPLDGVRSVELRTDGSKAVAVFEGTPGPSVLDAVEHAAVNGRTARGDAQLTLQVDGLSLRVSPRSFFQVNLEINEALVQHVKAAVLNAGPERVLDLYSGIGNLALPIAARGVPTVAVEIEGQATADLRANADTHGLPIEVHTGKVENFDTSRVAFDAVVLDPPRAGAPNVMKKLLFQRPKVIVVVACHVPSGARDIRPALDAGYTLRSVTCFDMFPDTHHIETVFVMQR